MVRQIQEVNRKGLEDLELYQIKNSLVKDQGQLMRDFSTEEWVCKIPHTCIHGLRTPNEGINERNLKIWANKQTKNALVVPKDLGEGVDFRPCSEDDFLTGRP